MAFEARLGTPGVATVVAQEGRVVTLVADHLAPGEGQSPRAGEHAVPMSRSPATQPRTTIFLKNDCQEVELFPMSNFGPEVDIRPGQLLEELRIVPTGDSPHPADRDGESTEDPHSLVAAGTSPSTTSPVDSPDAANSADTILEIEDAKRPSSRQPSAPFTPVSFSGRSHSSSKRPSEPSMPPLSVRRSPFDKPPWPPEKPATSMGRTIGCAWPAASTSG